jgi:hypothetical protein
MAKGAAAAGRGDENLIAEPEVIIDNDSATTRRDPRAEGANDASVAFLPSRKRSGRNAPETKEAKTRMKRMGE